MPYKFDLKACSKCPKTVRCIEDRRTNRVAGRDTQFRILQNNALECTFEAFVPGFETGPKKSYSQYLAQWSDNATAASKFLFGTATGLTHSQVAKCSGDVLQMLLASALWNAAADWNTFMDGGNKPTGSRITPNAVASPDRKVALVTLPRGYDATLLFTPPVRSTIKAFKNALQTDGMELAFSSPDIVGVRLPHPLPAELAPFLSRLPNLKKSNREALESAYKLLEGKIHAWGFLFAIAVKSSVRSDRLYQPLFEANVLKYLVQEVLRGSALRFIVYVVDPQGAAVEKHYSAASLFSLLRGGKPEKAIDKLVIPESPADVIDVVLKELPKFPI